MWVISFLPNWVFHLILSIGIIGTIAGFVLGFIPFVKQYKLPIQLISLLLLSLGLYLEGGLADYKEWEAKVKELEAKMLIAEEKSKVKNVEIQEKVVTKTRIVREQAQKQIEYIDRVIKEKEEVKVFIEHCPIPKDIIDEHNKAALNKASEGTKK